MGFSTFQYQQALARLNRQNNGARLNGCADESELHRQILDECSRRGWIAFHARMDQPTTLMKGAPDFMILRDGGETLFVECKRRDGKVSVGQAAVIAWAKQLGHTIHVVRSLEQFIGLCKQ